MDRAERFNILYNTLRDMGLFHTQVEFAEIMKSSKTNVSSARKGDERVLTDRFLKRFYKAFVKNLSQYSLGWLLTGQGEMLVRDVNTSTNNNSSSVLNRGCNNMNTTTNYATNNYGSCCRDVASEAEGIPSESEDKPKRSYTAGRPYYNVDFIGGFDLFLNDNTIDPEYNIDFTPLNKSGIMWCNMTGNSMYPKLISGSIIAIKEILDWQNYLTFGEIYAIVTSNDLRTVRIIRKSADENNFRLVPINTTEYDEQEIKKNVVSRVFEVLGSIQQF